MSLNVDEAYIGFGEFVGGFGLRLGRQNFRDERKWLYDSDLDAVRLFFERAPLKAELSASRSGLVGTDILNSDGPAERINNYVLFVEYDRIADVRLNGYVVVRDDRADEEGTTILIGVRSISGRRSGPE